jgi:hypothetical protein
MKPFLIITFLLSVIQCFSEITITINDNQAGNLMNGLSQSEKESVTKLIITGEINETDFNTMRTSMPELTSVDISGTTIKGVTGNTMHIDNRIPFLAFYNKTKLTEVKLPNTATSIYDSALNGCKGLTSISIPASVTNIGNSVFANCTNLVSISIPANVSSIMSNAFSGCASLNEILVDASNIYYTQEDGVLFNKTKTNLIAFPGGKTGHYMIPEGIFFIANNAFNSCEKLTGLTVSASLVTFPPSSINNCINLTEINVNNSNTTYSSHNGVLYNKAATILIRVPEGKTGSANIVSGTITINANALYNCRNITEIVIPSSVIGIKTQAFSGCVSITELIIPNSVELLEGNSIKNCTQLETVVLSNQLTVIEENTFSNNPALKYVTIPGGVTDIKNGAFEKCTALEHLDLPEHLKNIGMHVFSDCTSLKSFTLPENIETIGNNAFFNCQSLTLVIIPESVTSIGSEVFMNCSALKSIVANKEIPVNLISSARVFEGVDKVNCTLYVPSQLARNAYSVADKWREFNNIVIGVPVSLSPVSQNTRIYSGNKSLIIEGTTAKTKIVVYDLSGRMVFSTTANGSSTEISLGTTGIFMLEIAGEVQKIAVR